MLFNSFDFLLFFPVVTLIYFLLPHGWRWLHLLIASCVFYCAFVPAYILILFFTILIDYIAALYIEGAGGKRRKRFLVLSIIANVGVLAVFKYYNFFIGNVNELLSALQLKVRPAPLLQILLPIGLSFHTFQAMSYTIEVYRGRQQAERHLGIYALYVMFYPQLVAGPIERPQNILHQFRERHTFNAGNLAVGLRLMLWGFFMKVVVADRLSLYVEAAYGNVGQHNGTTLLLATVLFAFQIYCDFAGYSYIAIGAARTMGFRLMTNFNRPYLATSVATFWKRWHISLSTWFRDYVYIPLGGSRVGRARHYGNLMAVFLLSGLWHGANWTFVIWGGLNGLYLIVESLLAPERKHHRHKPWRRLAGMMLTFLLVSFSWIFFRAATVAQAFAIIHKIVTDPVAMPFQNWGVLVYSALGLGILLGADYLRERQHGHWYFAAHRSAWVRLVWYTGVILLILLFGVFDGGQFIYFQF
ncbi:MBOAT family O-acyltransferase [Taibaiella helva]|uniref:MBOAT family O-acyltransferase n=1 Tax=Taibaiella helva TaxID=2301235 RepID=UPI000E5863C0|nr:MBOAT family O-acyltransferase [Taibaiella helva]